MQYFYSTQITNDSIFLDAEETQHATRVLRKSVGDEIYVLDGKGSCFLASIQSIGKEIKAEIISVHQVQAQPPLKLHLAVSPTKKADRMEWMVEKMVEIGVHQISFINTEKGERSKLNLERMEKKVCSAMKQSGGLWMPQIQQNIKFANFLDTESSTTRLIAHCFDDKKNNVDGKLGTSNSVCVLIGPEGDFSKKEVAAAIGKGFIPISLGESRLRTETAAVVACTLVNHFCVTLKLNS